jgi:hypothetical protein
MDTTRLTLLEFELAYLALLTQNGTKPLSRWEGVVPHGIEEVIEEMGLAPAEVARKVMAVASALALAATGAVLYAPTSGLVQATMTGDPHSLPLAGGTDLDGDFLPDVDEPHLGMQPNDPDSDDNGILDGVQVGSNLPPYS